MRFPEKAARRSAESRGQGSLVPAPAGHIAFREEEPPTPASRVSARGSAERLGRSPQAARLRAAPSPRRRGRAPWHTPTAGGERPYGPSGPSHRRLCPSGRQPSLVARAQRSSGREREVSVPAATGAAPLCARKPSPWPCPRPRPPLEEGAVNGARTERASGADQTLSTKGVRSLSPAASRGAQEYPAT